MYKVFLAVLFSGLATGVFGQETPSKPNIIFILADDLGLGDVGCCGGPFKTPQLDALAKSGTRFEFCYSTPLCGPSRCQFLTGRYPFRTGLVNNQSHNAVAPSREVMIPTVLKKAGYVTASVGKWGQICLGPGEWGFDEYLVFPGSGRYWRDQTTHYNVNGVQKNLPAGVHLPDLMHEFIVEFLNHHKDKPFFLYYPMSHIHGPIVATPDSKGGGKDKLYADNISYMDKLVGKLMAELDRLHLREKTVVLFAGDNGTARFGVAAATVNGRPISGMKATMLEGGSRVPLLVSWPGVTPAGKVSRDLTDFSDFFPTFAELAGAKLPEGVTIDGHSFAAQIKGEAGKPRESVYVELNGKRFVATSRWKLNQAGELFDMKEAPYKEIPVPAGTTDPEAVAARKQLQETIESLVGKNPAAGREAPGGNGAGKRGRKRNRQ